MADGRVVPFLGAGASLCDRPEEWRYDPADPTYLPSAGEVAEYLAEKFKYPGEDRDLLRVSQYVDVVLGRDPLYEKLHDLFAADYAPNSLHEFFATLPARLFREKGLPPRYPLIVTTNWDDALEQAFTRAEPPQQFHLVWYVAEGDERGMFRHRPPEGDERLIESPNEYLDVSTADCSVILKIHGAVDRTAPDWDRDSYVVTEDHYIEYLTDGTALTSLLPLKLAETLSRAHFLFLGYSLRDWNFRVILNKIWRARKRSVQSWAIQREVTDFDERFWAPRQVELREELLASYVARLAEEVVSYPASPESG